MPDAKPSFALSPDCLSAGTATPRAERADRRYTLLFAAMFQFLNVIVALSMGVFPLVFSVPATLGAGYWYVRRHGAVYRRRHELWRAPFTAEAEAFLAGSVQHFARLDEPGRELFRQRAKLFLDEVSFVGAGVEVTDALRWLAAASAIIPTLGFPEWQWATLREIIFRPEGYEDGSHIDAGGVVTEFEESGMIGNSGVFSGVMMLSSEDLEWEFAHPEDGANVGFHEFAHVMAGEDGVMLAAADRAGWKKLLKSERRRIARGDSLLDEYALTEEAEFFAVASELFFTIPRQLRRWHRELYAVLARSYRQDPCRWLGDCEPEDERPPVRRWRRRGGRRAGNAGDQAFSEM